MCFVRIRSIGAGKQAEGVLFMTGIVYTTSYPVCVTLLSACLSPLLRSVINKLHRLYFTLYIEIIEILREYKSIFRSFKLLLLEIEHWSQV